MMQNPSFERLLDVFFSYYLGGGETERDRYFEFFDVLKDEHTDRFMLHLSKGTEKCPKRNQNPLPFVTDGPCEREAGHRGPCVWIPAER